MLLICWLRWLILKNSASDWPDTLESQAHLLFSLPLCLFYPWFVSTAKLASFSTLHIFLISFPFSPQALEYLTEVKVLLVRIGAVFSLKKSKSCRTKFHMQKWSCKAHLWPSSRAYLFLDFRLWPDEWSHQSIAYAVILEWDKYQNPWIINTVPCLS